MFPLGDTLATFTATDAAGKYRNREFDSHGSGSGCTSNHDYDTGTFTLLNNASVIVTGTMTENAGLIVNGVTATINALDWTASVPLNEGNNLLTAVATDSGNNVGTATTQVTLDSTPPSVHIDTPQNGSITTETSVTVTGMLNDIVLGTVNAQDAQVTVNGVSATVANRSFLVSGIPLIIGQNLIEATAIDQAGNIANTSIQVIREDSNAQNRIQRVSGDNQAGSVGSSVADPLVVELLDTADNPVPNHTVIFKVVENNGTISNGGSGARSLAMTTNTQGRAQVQWTLGTRFGAGNNRVEATEVGFTGHRHLFGEHVAQYRRQHRSRCRQ